MCAVAFYCDAQMIAIHVKYYRIFIQLVLQQICIKIKYSGKN